MSSNGTNQANGTTKHSHADWDSHPRWAGITRPYSYDDVLRLRGTIQIEYTLARLGAERCGT
jgi:isocitrate lyase